jgi:hypothetical protein
MAFDQMSPSHAEQCEIETIRQFWDEVLKRLKVRAELATLGAQSTTFTNPDSSAQIDSDEKQPG